MKALLRIRVIPNAARRELVGCVDGVWKVKVQAPPEDGRANRAVIELLAGALACPKRALEIASGENSRVKTLGIEGVELVEVEARLRAYLD